MKHINPPKLSLSYQNQTMAFHMLRLVDDVFKANNPMGKRKKVNGGRSRRTMSGGYEHGEGRRKHALGEWSWAGTMVWGE